MISQNRNNYNKLAFIIGAGMSQAAGLPGTKCITRRVLSGKRVYRYTDRNYYFCPPSPGDLSKYAPRMAKLAKLLVDVIRESPIVTGGYEPTYEEFYHTATQIANYCYGDTNYLSLGPFVKRIEQEALPLLRSPNDIIGDWPLIRLMDEFITYIDCIVWHMVAEPGNKNVIDRIMSEACNPSEKRRVSIFCLNHDTLIEECLKVRSLEYIDGFESSPEGFEYWNPSLFTNNDAPTRLFKLHGSIDWFYIDDSAWGKGNFPLYRNVPSEMAADMALSHPVILVGTVNKVIRYLTGVFSSLGDLFRRELSTTNHIVIAGYGFRDIGINQQLLDWLITTPKGSVVVVDCKPMPLESLPRPIREVFQRSKDRILYDFIPDGIENTCWDRIADSLYRET